MPAAVSETFFAVHVRDMQRGTAFYCEALGGTISFPSPGWTSLKIAGVRVGIALVPDHNGSRGGLHFAVADLAAGCAEVERAGGRVVQASVEVAPGVVIAEVEDTEGNGFVLVQR